MNNWFTNHPHSIGENYWLHMRFALIFGFKMILGGLACIIHAIFPFLFQKTGSAVLVDLMEVFISRLPAREERLKRLARVITQKSQQEEQF